MTSFSDLTALLRIDLNDARGELLGDDDLGRALSRAVLAINRDIGRSYEVIEDAGSLFVTPDIEGEDSELALLRAHAFCCSMLRSAASANFSFTSADKKVDKSMQAKAWADLEKDLLAKYRETVSRLNPAMNEGLLPVENLSPQIYEVGSDVPSE